MNDNLYLNEFDSYLKNEKHSSDNTRQSYLRDIRQFGKFSGDDLLSADTDSLSAYIAHLKNQGRSSSTVARNVASLKAFSSLVIATIYLSLYLGLGVI